MSMTESDWLELLEEAYDAGWWEGTGGWSQDFENDCKHIIDRIKSKGGTLPAESD